MHHLHLLLQRKRKEKKSFLQKLWTQFRCLCWSCSLIIEILCVLQMQVQTHGAKFVYSVSTVRITVQCTVISCYNRLSSCPGPFFDQRSRGHIKMFVRLCYLTCVCRVCVCLCELCRLTGRPPSTGPFTARFIFSSGLWAELFSIYCWQVRAEWAESGGARQARAHIPSLLILFFPLLSFSHTVILSPPLPAPLLCSSCLHHSSSSSSVTLFSNGCVCVWGLLLQLSNNRGAADVNVVVSSSVITSLLSSRDGS